jgi:hypothetical protein
LPVGISGTVSMDLIRASSSSGVAGIGEWGASFMSLAGVQRARWRVGLRVTLRAGLDFGLGLGMGPPSWIVDNLELP